MKMGYERDMDRIVRLANEHRNQVIQELIEKALGSEADNYKAYDGYVAEWLRSQMEEENDTTR
jgi:Mg/Co/Ni transporter MgtE